MRTHALVAILCLQWVLLTLPVHSGVAASHAAPAEMAHCATPSPADSPPADSVPRGDDVACLLHCTTLAQAAVGALPSVSASGSLLLPLPATASAALRRSYATAPAAPGLPGPPASALLLQNSVLRL